MTDTKSKSDIIIYDSGDVARILGCSIRKARLIMKSRGFPLLKVGKVYKVTKPAFDEWSSNRHIL